MTDCNDRLPEVILFSRLELLDVLIDLDSALIEVGQLRGGDLAGILLRTAIDSLPVRLYGGAPPSGE